MSVVITERLVQSLALWVYIINFIYDGEPFDYMFDAGSIMVNEKAARACVVRNDYKRQAQRKFLEDVHLETQH